MSSEINSAIRQFPDPPGEAAYYLNPAFWKL